MQKRTVKRGRIAAVVVALYILACGPVFRLVEERLLPEPVVLAIYAPLFPLSKVPVLRTVIAAYLRLWMRTPAS